MSMSGELRASAAPSYPVKTQSDYQTFYSPAFTSSSSPMEGALIPGINKVAGPLLLAGGLNWGLYGALFVQVYVYFIAFPNDRPALKMVVYWVFAVETLQSFLIIIDVFQNFVLGYAHLNPEALADGNTVWLSVPILTGVVTFSCQGFFAYRIWVFSQYRLLKVAFFAIAATCIIQLGASISLGVLFKRDGRLDKGNADPAFKRISGIWLASSSLGDGLIAVCMLYMVSKTSTHFEQTRRTLQKIVRITIGTGSLTAAVAIATLILLLLPGQPYFQTSLTTLGKLYSNSLMVMLNNRVKLNSEGSKFENEMHMGSMSMNSSHIHQPRPVNIELDAM